MSTTTFTPAPPPGAYVLTPEELEEALRETARIACEYWGVGFETEKAAARAAAEMLGRLEGER